MNKTGYLKRSGRALFKVCNPGTVIPYPPTKSNTRPSDVYSFAFSADNLKVTVLDCQITKVYVNMLKNLSLWSNLYANIFTVHDAKVWSFWEKQEKMLRF